MELRVRIEYEQMLEIVRQLPVDDISRLLNNTRQILEEKKQETPQSSPEDFQRLLLSAPVMSDEQYQTFLENRKLFNKWREK